MNHLYKGVETGDKFGDSLRSDETPYLYAMLLGKFIGVAPGSRLLSRRILNIPYKEIPPVVGAIRGLSFSSYHKPLNLSALGSSSQSLKDYLPHRQWIIRSRWYNGFDRGSADRYLRLNRFQQYQDDPKLNGGNQLYKVTLLGVSLMVGIFFISPYLFQYVPPFNHFKRNPSHLVYTLLAANVAIYGLWQMPRCWRFLQKYMLLEKGYMSSKWSLIGSAFSHQEGWHLGMNMLALWSFGTSLAAMLGAPTFFSLYINSALAGSLFSLWYPRIAKLAIMGPSLGASGALFGVFGCFAYLFPSAKLLLFIFPIPAGAWTVFLASTLWNVVGCAFRFGSFDYAAHLGGSLIGVAYGWYIGEARRKERERRLARASRWF